MYMPSILSQNARSNTVATKSIATFGFFHKDPMLNGFRAVTFFRPEGEELELFT
jgi:hypothetical protein